MTVVYLPECCLSELAISISLFAAVAERIIELLDQRPHCDLPGPPHLAGPRPRAGTIAK
ncbi:MAG: hypothetical protein M3332_10205 [Actinomycetota bacterium]|jgi:hypothetical protein|nr:hypothetical protein [Actinomycetota bacterium]